jgi:hypothetical protein
VCPRHCNLHSNDDRRLGVCPPPTNRRTPITAREEERRMDEVAVWRGSEGVRRGAWQQHGGCTNLLKRVNLSEKRER